MIYYLRHDTNYEYAFPVNESRQLLRLTPRELPHQKCLAYRRDLNVAPAQRNLYTDAFGNQIEALHFENPHETFHLRVQSWVELSSRPELDLFQSPPWESVRDNLSYRGGLALSPDFLEASNFLFESEHVRVKRDFATYASRALTPGMPILAGTSALMNQIFLDFTFDPLATDISTPVTEVFEQKRGVCQDFAHFMLSCLRSLGLAARYMSGYILTHPPQGQARMIGADATHAWVSVFCPGVGWVDFDPTNGLLPNLEHVTLGWGRDFADVTPLRGVILGGGEHTLKIAVTMAPQSDFEKLFLNLPTQIPLLSYPVPSV